jgi:hypothetical protein
MKTPLIVGTTLILAGVVAFALARDDRDTTTVETPAVEEQSAQAPAAELADPGKIEEPAAPEVLGTLPEGWEIDETGFVWEPLSFEPQVRHNADGTLTMKKLARVYDVETGEMTLKPVTAHAIASQKRIPVKQRSATSAAKAKPETAQDGE